MDIINKIENQTKKYMELRQELDGIIKALNELPAWAQSIDDAINRVKELRRGFLNHYKVKIFFPTGDEWQEVFNHNAQVLSELEEIKGYLASWLETDDVEYKED